MDNELKSIADVIYELTSKLIDEGNTPFAVAAVYTMIAMQIYRTGLSEDEYNAMVDTISAARDKVQILTDIGRTLN
jgi:hypothetical protein